jgi:ferredoxin-NADP reductase/predicted pyridoxine 5'-phosphate oxidase superfamily flavin-nucleotide-binding protein
MPEARPPFVTPSPWHQGERQLHGLAGDVAQMEDIGRRFLRDHMPYQHRAFFAQLPYVVLGAVDAQGQPWATLIEGEAGFMHSPHPRKLRLASAVSAGDPAHGGVHAGAAVGLLGIAPHSRRRNRLNGRIGHCDAQGFEIDVQESFGNCPQYIQAREALNDAPSEALPAQTIERFTQLDSAAQAFIAEADTFFVASCFNGDQEHPEPRVDVSHRGGKPGFVAVQDQTLLIPDFSGNRFFNTLGNLLINPKAGLVFVDHTNGTVLQLAGSVDILMDGPEVHGFAGAERVWRFTVEQLVRRQGALAMRTRLVDYSPSLASTGHWAALSSPVAPALPAWRSLRVARVVQESDSVRSLYLEPEDGLPLAGFLPGQHLPVRWYLGGEGASPGQPGRTAFRNYSLSLAPAIGRASASYRLSVKRDGLVSAAMLESLQAGDTLAVGQPQGQFVLDVTSRQAVLLLAGGIGITPLLSMLHHLIESGERSGVARAVTLLYATRGVAERGFDAELASLVARSPQMLRVVRVATRPEPTVQLGLDYDVLGRVDAPLLRSLLGGNEPVIYLCGSPAFSQAMYDSLKDLGVPDDRIHAEAFGPAALQRRPPDRESSVVEPRVVDALTDPAQQAVAVHFSGSRAQAVWKPGGGSLLELAESAGLNPVYGCRGGHCGSCRTKVLEGQVTYRQTPGYAVEPDEALICCAVPAVHAGGKGGPLVLDL